MNGTGETVTYTCSVCGQAITLRGGPTLGAVPCPRCQKWVLPAAPAPATEGDDPRRVVPPSGRRRPVDARRSKPL